MAGNIPDGPWKSEVSQMGVVFVMSKEGRVCETFYKQDASFIAAARTDCPMVMEMVIEMIDDLTTCDVYSPALAERMKFHIISRFEATHGPITQEQVESL